MDATPNGKNIVPEKKEDMKLVNGMLEPQTLNELFRVATCYVKSGILPSGYDTPEKVITALQYARELGLPGLTSLREIAVINGKPSIFGTLPLSIVQGSGHLESIREFYIDEKMKEISFENENLGAKIFGSVTIVKRKGDINSLTQFYTIKMAEGANLFKNNVWKQYPERMLRYRSRAMALKDKFADVLGGTAIKEYDYEVEPEGPRNLGQVNAIDIEAIPKQPLIAAQSSKASDE